MPAYHYSVTSLSDPSHLPRTSIDRRTHSRNASAVSSTTLRTDYSHPNEPLLPPEHSQSASGPYIDEPFRPPGPGNTSSHGWDTGITLEAGSSATPREKKEIWNQTVRRRSRRSKYVKVSLELFLGGWAVYNTVRYILAYTSFDSLDGQNVSLALGISTILAFTLFVYSTILSLLQPYLLHHRVSSDTIRYWHISLQLLSSFFIVSPAIVNFVLLFVWRDSSDQELKPGARCHVDIDVVWSVSNSTQCTDPPAWGVWLALSLTRLVLTLFVISLYHVINSWIRLSLQNTKFSSRNIENYASRSSQSTSAAQMTEPLTSTTAFSHSPNHNQNITPSQNRSSNSTLRSQATSSKLSSPVYPSMSSGRLTHASSSIYGDEPETSGLYNHEGSSGWSPPELRRTQGTIASGSNSPSDRGEPGPDQEIHHFVDRFRSLLHQVNEETDQDVEYSHVNLSPINVTRERDLPPLPSSHLQTHPNHDPPQYSPAPDTATFSRGEDRHQRQRRLQPYLDIVDPEEEDDEEDDEFNPYDELNYTYPTPSRNPVLGYNEFGRPYPPDEHIEVLGGIVRRMPTIESMGSREMGSVASSVHQGHGMRVGSLRSARSTASRAPTRTATIRSLVPPSPSEYSPTAAGSVALSRASSFGLNADMIVAGMAWATSGADPVCCDGKGVNEVGELTGGDKRYLGGSGGSGSNPSRVASTGSRGTGTSFYTAGSSLGAAATE